MSAAGDGRCGGGGDDDEHWMTPATWALDLERNPWRRLADLDAARHGHGAAALGPTSCLRRRPVPGLRTHRCRRDLSRATSLAPPSRGARALSAVRRRRRNAIRSASCCRLEGRRRSPTASVPGASRERSRRRDRRSPASGTRWQAQLPSSGGPISPGRARRSECVTAGATRVAEECSAALGVAALGWCRASIAAECVSRVAQQRPRLPPTCRSERCPARHGRAVVVVIRNVPDGVDSFVRVDRVLAAVVSVKVKATTVPSCSAT